VFTQTKSTKYVITTIVSPSIEFVTIAATKPTSQGEEDNGHM
jgi:hypothetical protein